MILQICKTLFRCKDNVKNTNFSKFLNNKNNKRNQSRSKNVNGLPWLTATIKTIENYFYLPLL